ncbi:hypothetical protein Rsub_08776 [Raphidocelis subcapitata]|uniref:Uncharacterized protein n=1 Tax=Raphidocelis subcapitata TaxID=307507 RepID=A0A2V0P8N9_9CHLO|nr:hypothetical protein Rsub_08776 [Raphidocelis subcapitata]|eukprot:GBF96231.1 hypothetical protein Rsub_08776 [Raphidocelis subcapitata]
MHPPGGADARAAAAAAAPGGGTAALAAAAVAAARARGDAPLLVHPLLLKFGDGRMEAAYASFSAPSLAAADACHLAAAAALAAAALLHACGLGGAQCGAPAARAAAAAGSVSAVGAAAVAALLLAAPAAYARFRGPLLAALRLLRVAAWLLARAAGGAAAIVSPSHIGRAFLISPAAGNLWFSLFFPLPLSTHAPLLAIAAAAAVAAGPPLAPALLASSELPAATAAACERLGRVTRLLDLPTHRLAPRDGGRQLAPADAAWTLHAFGAVAGGLVVPLLLLYLREVYARVRFLSRLQPLLSPRQVADTRGALYRCTLAACFLLLSLLPSLWGVLQLVPRYALAPGGGLRVDGLAFVGTVLGVEAFMRVWLLAVASLAFDAASRRALVSVAAVLLAWSPPPRAPPPPPPPGQPSPPPARPQAPQVAASSSGRGQ